MRLLILLIIVLLASSVYGEIAKAPGLKVDFVVKSPSLSKAENISIASVVNPTANEDLKGHLYIKVIEAIAPVSGATGIPGKKVTTLYYDVLAEVKRDRYKVDDIIETEVTIINKGYVPDRDGILVTYLEDPDENKFREKRMVFELIPPTCPRGFYDWYEDVCDLGNNETEEPRKTVIQRNLTAPTKASLGEWRYVAEYETTIQPPIYAYDPFEIYRGTTIMLLWILVGLVTLALLRKTKKRLRFKFKKKKKWEKKEPSPSPSYS